MTFASSGGSTLHVALLSWSSGGNGTLWEIVASKDWLNGSLDYALPDFSATAGWNSAWDFPSGITVDGTLVAFHADVPFASYQALISAPGGAPDPSTFQSSQFTFSGTY